MDTHHNQESHTESEWNALFAETEKAIAQPSRTHPEQSFAIVGIMPTTPPAAPVVKPRLTGPDIYAAELESKALKHDFECRLALVCAKCYAPHEADYYKDKWRAMFAVDSKNAKQLLYSIRVPKL
jgi:hypothetical protein